jgi:hypothetical protein
MVEEEDIRTVKEGGVEPGANPYQVRTCAKTSFFSVASTTHHGYFTLYILTD